MNLIPTREKYTSAISSRLHKEDINYGKLCFFFFELDNPLNKIHFNRICELYRQYRIDFLVHRTGNGRHFLGVTLITMETWHEMMDKVKDINPRCPQINLRWKNNKYVQEKEIWFIASVGYCNDGTGRNSYELVNLLNSFFHTNFKGNYPTVLRFTGYRQNYETK